MPGLLSPIARFFLIARFTLLQFIQRRVLSLQRSWLFAPQTQPDAWKVLAHRTDLYKSRVFRPKIDDARRLPLVIMVHGGGMVFNNPSCDDPLARYLADTCGCLVVSIDYRKAPLYPFPAGYEDIVESIVALLGNSGNDILADPSKIVLCGSSGGGNLILGSCQDERIRGKILGIAALYPLVNLAPSAEEQLARRPDPSIPDLIGGMWDSFHYLYARTDDEKILKDPRLSPTYFKERSDLPLYIFMSGCEHDMLCYEAEAMAEKIADTDALPKMETADGWKAGNLRWRFIKGQSHAFEHFPAKTREMEEARLRERDSLYNDIAVWLKEILQ